MKVVNGLLCNFHDTQHDVVDTQHVLFRKVEVIGINPTLKTVRYKIEYNTNVGCLTYIMDIDEFIKLTDTTHEDISMWTPRLRESLSQQPLE